MSTRRSFIKQTSMLSLAAFVNPSTLLYNQHAIGLQLYTLRADIVKDPKGVIEKVAALGYNEVESFGYRDGKYFGMAASEFATLLNNNKLSHPSGHYMLPH